MGFRLRPRGKVRLRKGRWSGYYHYHGKQSERQLAATTREEALEEIEAIIDAAIFGVASATGAAQVLALAALLPPDHAGCYAIVDERGFVKIGKATNIRKRIAQLQGMSPRPYRLVAILSRTTSYEAALHRRLKRCGWVRGEWFAPTPQVIAEIRAARGRL